MTDVQGAGTEGGRPGLRPAVPLAARALGYAGLLPPIAAIGSAWVFEPWNRAAALLTGLG